LLFVLAKPGRPDTQSKNLSSAFAAHNAQHLEKPLLDIILGISAAFGWGVADFSARFSARRIGAFRTLIVMQFFGFAALSAFLWLTGGFSRSFAPGWTPWLFAAIAGLINTISGLALYRSFEVGAIRPGSRSRSLE
jgi:drug/metabolite transporter (DMT)-like permease